MQARREPSGRTQDQKEETDIVVPIITAYLSVSLFVITPI